MVVEFCCAMMRDQLESRCPVHDDPSDCPDTLVARFSDGSSGLYIHDGGSSVVMIAYCPWCGAALPTD